MTLGPRTNSRLPSLRPGTVFQARLDAGQQPADGAVAVVMRQVAGEHGSGLGHPVAFEQYCTGLAPQLARRLLHPLRARHRIVQAGELAGLGSARIAREEGVGGHDPCRLHLLDELGHLAVVQRARVEHALHPGEQWHERSGRQAKGMEHRQRIDQHVAGDQHAAQMGDRLLGIGHEVRVGKHDAFRRALGARGEEDDGRLVGLLRRRTVDARCQQGARGAAQLVEDADAGAHVLEIDDARLGARRVFGLAQRGDELLQVAGFDKALGGQHGAQLRGADGGAQRLLTGGEIENRGDAVIGVEAEQRDGEAGGVRQQDADVLAGPGEFLDAAAEDEAGNDQAGIGEGRAVGVLEDDLFAAMRGRSFDNAGKERGARAGEVECKVHRNGVFRPVGRVRCSRWGAACNRRSRWRPRQQGVDGALCAAAKFAAELSMPRSTRINASGGEREFWSAKRQDLRRIGNFPDTLPRINAPVRELGTCCL